MREKSKKREGKEYCTIRRALVRNLREFYHKLFGHLRFINGCRRGVTCISASLLQALLDALYDGLFKGYQSPLAFIHRDKIMEALKVTLFCNLPGKSVLVDPEEAEINRNIRAKFSQEKFDKIFNQLGYSYLLCFFQNTLAKQAKKSEFNSDVENSLNILEELTLRSFLHKERIIREDKV